MPKSGGGGIIRYSSPQSKKWGGRVPPRIDALGDLRIHTQYFNELCALDFDGEFTK